MTHPPVVVFNIHDRWAVPPDEIKGYGAKAYTKRLKS
jgi:hypothetical protein